VKRSETTAISLLNSEDITQFGIYGWS